MFKNQYRMFHILFKTIHRKFLERKSQKLPKKNFFSANGTQIMQKTTQNKFCLSLYDERGWAIICLYMEISLVLKVSFGTACIIFFALVS